METVRCGSETREVEMKGVEGEDFCGEIERNTNEGKEGPGDESEERRSPDDERERMSDVFGMDSKGSDEEQCGVGEDLTKLSASLGVGSVT